MSVIVIFIYRSVVVVTVKVGVVTFQNIGKKVIAGKLRFEIVSNSHFYNYSIYRSVVVATVNMGMVSKSKIIGRKSYCL